MSSKRAIGIDIGGTNTTIGLVARDGAILQQTRLKTKSYETPDAFVEALRAAIAPMREGGAEIVGIGVGAPNANFYTGEIVHAANLIWKGIIPLARMLREATGLPVTITNDANAAALGEGAYGAAKGLADYLVVTLGTGLGSGFVANGKLIYGHDGFAGELGHIISVRGGRPCGCGRAGCLETYVSASGIVRTAEQWLMERREPSVLHEISGRLTAWDIHQAAEKGDSLAIELFAFTGKMLGEALADAVAITSPAAIVLFGGLSKAGDLLLGPVREHFDANVLSLYKGNVQILLSALPDADAAVLGASALAWGDA
jgi:glucokinase